AGTYKFFCDIHAGMVGYITVRSKGHSIPTAKQDAAARKRQAIGDIKAAKKVAKAKQPKDTVSLGESTPGGVELFAMFPTSLTVQHGTVVTFRMSAHSRETHTASFGPKAYLMPLANSFRKPVFSAIATYPSDKSQPLTLSPSSHGNGFANLGVLDRDSSTPVLPSGKIVFTKPGTYHFVCLIHPEMRGTIIVK
ncbi:MAG: hypothetical protein M3016_06955, partial [Actinomycetota bacterium]|nr:hypothetical protein [Actinomycetota bacterium]